MNTFMRILKPRKVLKGHPVAVISRNGRHYYNLKLMPGFGSRSMHDDVTEFVMDVLCTEAGRMEEGSE